MPTPKYVAYSWEAFQAGTPVSVEMLQTPLVVRSTYADEDGTEESKAGHFATVLHVEREDLKHAVQQVFDSYPQAEEQEVIIQEMIQPLFSGVLFAYRNGVWKIEINEGLGEQVVSGQVNAKSLILPRFKSSDVWMSRWFNFWNPDLAFTKETKLALIQLSRYAARLLDAFEEAPHGLDMEFSIVKDGLYLLQARPITTPDDEEQVLTSANHKEILPPSPSPLMTSIISSAGKDLFAFYKNLDNSLADRAFLVESSGMPWINLSALLDIMVHWGLPTSLVAKSVGAVDFYQVKFRFWRFLSKVPVFLRLQRQQSGVQKQIRDWVKKQRVLKGLSRNERELLWETQPVAALEHWIKDFRDFYIELVTYMQLLTGAMSGPVSIANRLGILSKRAAQLKQNSASTDYLNAFQELKNGLRTQESFLRKFGHRGFYESDIGQKRFWEYTDRDWQYLPDQTWLL